jgi:hypothetical protein
MVDPAAAKLPRRIRAFNPAKASPSMEKTSYQLCMNFSVSRCIRRRIENVELGTMLGARKNCRYAVITSFSDWHIIGITLLESDQLTFVKPGETFRTKGTVTRLSRPSEDKMGADSRRFIVQICSEWQNSLMV